ncbi:hypothetical protein LEP1GSC060_3647 [Leptospira weilii serovar Ranarum str. ICFT]|uniref:Lipoprotein n=1 Tax=Leptospira weilii serovar Ranarum str. ICFT TaxID=1218598 RepID=N1WJV1_9LEPT|nr:hypothetical protein LEP1GSC060_3647 [Leptospira weilii serovar Ranarum str. ICFT]
MKNFFLSVMIFSVVATCSRKDDKVDNSVLSLLLLQSAQPADPDRVENYDRDVQIITHTMPPASPWYTFDLSYSEEDLDVYVTLLRAQIAKYPRGYWIKAKAEKIYLVKYINGVNGGGARGLSLGSENGIYLSVGVGIASCNGCEEDYSSTIHHELMHNVDYSQFGPSYYLTTDDWNGLNPVGFQYGSVSNSGAAANVWTHIIHPLSGFLSYYGTTNKLEDRAIFAAAILGGLQQFQSDTVINFCQADPIVAAKTIKLISNMNRFWPFPGADGTFWKTRITEIENGCK